MTQEEFKEQLLVELSNFVKNMNALLPDGTEHSFPDWYKVFGRWLEIGTDMEQVAWGTE